VCCEAAREDAVVSSSTRHRRFRTADDVRLVSLDADVDGPLIDYKEKGNKIELVGKEPVKGTDAYHLRLTRRAAMCSICFWMLIPSSNSACRDVRQT
jgi:hypothetical protein